MRRGDGTMEGLKTYTTESGIVVAWSATLRAWAYSFAGELIGWDVDRDLAIIAAARYADYDGMVLWSPLRG